LINENQTIMSFEVPKNENEQRAEGVDLSLKAMMDAIESQLNSEKDEFESGPFIKMIEGSNYEQDQIEGLKGFAQFLFEKATDSSLSQEKRGGCSNIMNGVIQKMMGMNGLDKK